MRPLKAARLNRPAAPREAPARRKPGPGLSPLRDDEPSRLEPKRLCHALRQDRSKGAENVSCRTCRSDGFALRRSFYAPDGAVRPNSLSLAWIEATDRLSFRLIT